MSAKSDLKEAKARIAKARAEGATRLDLSGLRDLKELPEEIATLTALTSLGLMNTQVSDITALAGLGGLTSLTLAGTPVSDITALVGLGALTWLDLRGSATLDLRPLRGLVQLANNPRKLERTDLIGGLTFTHCAAAKADPRIAEIAGIEDPATRARELFAYLEDWVPPVPADSPLAPPARPAPNLRREVFLPVVSTLTTRQITEVLRSSYPDLRGRAGHILAMVQQEKAMFALLPIPNEPEQLDEYRAKDAFLDTMIAGLVSLAEDLPETPPRADAATAKKLKEKLKNLATAVDDAITYLDRHEGTYGGLWKVGVISAVAGLLALISGAAFLPATLLPTAVLGAQTVKLSIKRGKDDRP